MSNEMVLQVIGELYLSKVLLEKQYGEAKAALHNQKQMVAALENQLNKPVEPAPAE